MSYNVSVCVCVCGVGGGVELPASYPPDNKATLIGLMIYIISLAKIRDFVAQLL